jgi:hypothetical protein
MPQTPDDLWGQQEQPQEVSRLLISFLQQRRD